MRVCDLCVDVKKRAGELRLVIHRPEPAGSRARPEPLGLETVELCEDCIAKFWQRVAAVARGVRHGEDDPPAADPVPSPEK